MGSESRLKNLVLDLMDSVDSFEEKAKEFITKTEFQEFEKGLEKFKETTMLTIATINGKLSGQTNVNVENNMSVDGDLNGNISQGNG